MALNANFLRRAPTPAAGKQKDALLVVDDEKEITASLSDQFRRDYRVLTANSAQEALRILEENDVSVIVSDERMPQMSGAELMARVHERNPDVTRILLTGYADLEAVTVAVNQGKIYFYMTKPWGAAELTAIVAKAMEHSHMLRERRELIASLQTLNAELENRVRERTLQLEQANARLDLLARTDPLTGLVNRRVLEEALEREIVRAEREKLPLCVVFVDIDHFKSINDSFGHPVGDVVLTAVSRALLGCVRPYDVLARYGGEEFVALLPGASLDVGSGVAERLRKAVAGLSVEGCPRAVTASFGVAGLAPSETAERLLARADAALYRAKQGGRDRVERAAGETP